MLFLFKQLASPLCCWTVPAPAHMLGVPAAPNTYLLVATPGCNLVPNSTWAHVLLQSPKGNCCERERFPLMIHMPMTIRALGIVNPASLVIGRSGAKSITCLLGMHGGVCTYGREKHKPQSLQVGGRQPCLCTQLAPNMAIRKVR